MIWPTLDDRVHDAQHTSKLRIPVLAALPIAFSHPTIDFSNVSVPLPMPPKASRAAPAEVNGRRRLGSGYGGTHGSRIGGTHGAAMGACTHGSGYGARPAAKNGARTLRPSSLHRHRLASVYALDLTLSRRTLPACLFTRSNSFAQRLSASMYEALPSSYAAARTTKSITTIRPDHAQALPRTRRTRLSLSASAEAKDFFTRLHLDDYILPRACHLASFASGMTTSPGVAPSIRRLEQPHLPGDWNNPMLLIYLAGP
ncbi:uncharacterized protein SCHCODRAFT_02552997 [Schizophyllum commune H4-8]|nr:uncharacterized protein SCHCODRAFT_02552997 [Schizophyllum commune H4-8]KAI5887740.1 hypothetical protein SCHCODRAFT_02552997 [Schizophyllum commune H4-8]